MGVVISLLRGVNLASHRRIKMDALRGLYESLGLRDVRSYLQSGNLVFRADDLNSAALARRIESGIERSFGFHTDVILRTPADLRNVIARNPFGRRRDVEPSKLLVTFLAADPTPQAVAAMHSMNTAPEEVHIAGREIYVYYPNGMARPKISFVQVEKALKTSATGRNWNTVTRLLEISEQMEASGAQES
jgi:uncharacterized protein (DUF1697 family)